MQKKDIILGKAAKFLKGMIEQPVYKGTFGQNFYAVIIQLKSFTYQSLSINRVELGDTYPGSVFFQCTVPDFTKNTFMMAHGGALTTYIDISTTAALYAFDEKERANVSAKLDMDFLSAAAIGKDIEIEARINRIGKSMAFLEGRIIDLQTKQYII
ncbi:UNKNOWN [Stylonychia lemnae]|uniref:Thioesterase domain-containing protein n=1 Tax=Stylonychia lemnae TaxID=5949 RepID=A0A077ZUZ7_STYLE|nr:UNKNOWN [Stylonychia lemnae]|eukprot:CDW72266.1 UNKNOWN [Stylonychia lemnae]